jgi:hypothetical protein
LEAAGVVAELVGEVLADLEGCRLSLAFRSRPYRSHQ